MSSRTRGLSGDPGAGSVAALEAFADASGTDSDWRTWQASVVRQAHDLLAGQGRSVVAVRQRLTEIADRLDELGAASGSLREVVRAYADEVAEVQTSASALREAELEAVARASRYRMLVLDGDPTLGRPPWQAPPTRRMLREPRLAWELGQWHEAVAEHDDVTRRWGDLVSQRDGLDEHTAHRLERLPGLSPARHRSAGGGARQVATVAAPIWSGPGTVVSAADLAALGDADAVRAVWDQLDEVQRRSLISNEPMITGNLNGIPIQFRAEANRLNMRAEIARIDRLLAAVGQASIYNEFRDRETVPGLRKQRDDLEYYLDAPQTIADASGGATSVVGVPVVSFDPGASAIATYRGPFDDHGDIPSWVENVAIHVPGTGTSLSSFRETFDRSVSLYDRARGLLKQEGAGPTVVFAWAGGRLPMDIPEATNPRFSRDLGPQLRDFSGAVDTNPAGSTLTVTGHSYGAAVVGRAEAEGLKADRVLYVSAAGLGNGNKRVADFPFTGEVPHYALMVRNDLVVGSIKSSVFDFMHGGSPLTDADVVRLETGFLDANNPVRNEDLESVGGIRSHSDVYAVGTTSFENIVQTIVGGRVETYAQEGQYRPPVAQRGSSSIVIDGIDRPDYEPIYVAVK